jgi:hypothetical protein
LSGVGDRHAEATAVTIAWYRESEHPFLPTVTDRVEFALQRELVQHVDAKAREDLDSRIELPIGPVERAPLLVIATFDSSGIENPQWAVSGCPGQIGQTSAAALLQTVKTKSSGGASGVTNSSQLLLRKSSTARWLRRSASRANGCTLPLGWLPALNAWNRPRPQKFSSASAMTLRAELPVQRNNTV